MIQSLEGRQVLQALEDTSGQANVDISAWNFHQQTVKNKSTE